MGHAKTIVESGIDSRLAVDGSVVKYRDRVVGFSQKEGVSLVEVDASVVGGFKVHRKDSYDYRLFKVLAHDADLRDDGVWQVANDPELCSFKFTSGQHSLEVRYVVIASAINPASLITRSPQPR